MKKSSIYIRDEDLRVWEECKILNNGAMSQLIANLLTEWRDRQPDLMDRLDMAKKAEDMQEQARRGR